MCKTERKSKSVLIFLWKKNPFRWPSLRSQVKHLVEIFSVKWTRNVPGEQACYLICKHCCRSIFDIQKKYLNWTYLQWMMHLWLYLESIQPVTLQPPWSTRNTIIRFAFIRHFQDNWDYGGCTVTLEINTNYNYYMVLKVMLFLFFHQIFPYDQKKNNCQK